VPIVVHRQADGVEEAASCSGSCRYAEQQQQHPPVTCQVRGAASGHGVSTAAPCSNTLQ
jgi:hypothetical protein